MVKELVLVVADQLFQNHPAISKDLEVVMIESLKECQRLPYHKFKLAYLLTCMREYAANLKTRGHKVHYFELEKELDFEQALKQVCQKFGFGKIKMCQPSNKYFYHYLLNIFDKLNLNYEFLDNPNFLLTPDEFQNYSEKYSKKRTLMNDFYIWQRKRMGILLNYNQTPFGGKWSLDEENRKKLPKTQLIPERTLFFESIFYEDVKNSVEKYFPKNPGKLAKKSWLPVNFTQAEKHLQEFFIKFLNDFGDFEDALSNRDPYLFHSTLSPLLNYSILTPKFVLEKLDKFLNGGLFEPNLEKLSKVKLNSLEGFVRQIVGWREWIRGMYNTKYDENFLEMNFFQAKNPLPNYFYNYDLVKEIQENTPLCVVLTKVDELAWCHHIERLMVLGNWMTLNEYNPKEVYRWFLSQFVDGFEWVMVPNVFGMGIFADGGIFATKPYISGGNYLKKMSDYPNSEKWEKLWTDKFWAFLIKHEKYFSQQPRLTQLLKRKLRK